MRGRRRSRSAGRFLVLLSLSFVWPAVGRADPTLGFLESWPDSGNLHGWSGGASYSNPGHNGVQGPNDGYLVMSRSFVAQLGGMSVQPQYVGRWITAGIKTVQVWLNDVNTLEPLEIHFAIGRFDSFWQYNVGFIPPPNSWAPFTVDLTSSAGFTNIINNGTHTFEGALDSVEVVLFRHDLAPYSKSPDPIQGDVGIDELLLTDVVGVGSHPSSTLRPVELAAPYPNPARGPMTVSMTTFHRGEIRVQIVDALGRVLRQDVLPEAAAGPRQWTWDGRDGAGLRVAAGVYRVRAFSAAGGMSRPIVRLD